MLNDDQMIKLSKMEQPSNRRPGKVSFMPQQIRILSVEREVHGWLDCTFSDGTSAAYVVEELIELRSRAGN